MPHSIFLRLTSLTFRFTLAIILDSFLPGHDLGAHAQVPLLDLCAADGDGVLVPQRAVPDLLDLFPPRDRRRNGRASDNRLVDLLTARHKAQDKRWRGTYFDRGGTK